ncbi:MAG TPA: hypothetical protein DEO84_06635 [candidate division Zixibacteria bacterium]|jgi:hypothetical protein|nr:hypothetical protein [candidate division Zixibacteria bacterium]HBZ00982.1 hypothetical protein [candidate division Zixibacteria bacterium]
MKYYLGILIVMIAVMGCGKKSTKPTPEIPKLIMTVDYSNIGVGQSSILTITLENIGDPIFAISLQLTYDHSILSFSDSLDFEAGDFLGSNVIAFVREESSIIHLSITKLQGQSGASGSGIICLLHFNGAVGGISDLNIARDNLRFYDSSGELIDMPNLEIGSAQIQVN